MPRMTPNVLRNFINKRATRRYPFEVRSPFPRTRGELINKIDSCIFCSTCARKCPSQCIVVDKHQATWSCDPFACIYCGVCADGCPTHSLEFKDKYRPVAGEPLTIFLKGEMKKKKVPPKEAPSPATDDHNGSDSESGGGE